MVFSSHIFLYYFLPATLLVYFAFPWMARGLGIPSAESLTRWRNAWLLAASLIFFGWWSWRYVPLMLAITGVNYLSGWWMSRPGCSAGSRAWALRLAVGISLLNLAIFKYLGFFQVNVNHAFTWLSLPQIQVLEIALPLGISFYTFHAITYSVDIFRGEAQPARSFLDYACYITLFPQLVAGPIIRYQTVAGQLRERSHTLDRFSAGITLFVLGLGKKILLANPWGRIADLAFDAHALNAPEAWFGAVAYALQLYFDFSGYSDMAVGLARMVGFEFPRNFNAPYHADSITDFWRRWHISLSTFLRDYLYKPLGGNRRGLRRTYINLAIVMLLGGLWHGAGWTFLLWGAYHGALLSLERTEAGNRWLESWPHGLRVAVTLVLVLFSWVLFRSRDLPAAVAYLAAMFGQGGTDACAAFLTAQFYTRGNLVLFGLSVLLIARPVQAFEWSERMSWPRFALVTVLLAVSLIALAGQTANPFIYFQF